MNSNDIQSLFALACGVLILPTIFGILWTLTIQVDDEEAVLLTRFGKLHRTLREPGLHLWLERFLPWTRSYVVSLKRDFMTCDSIHVNDCRGTTVLVDLWLEYRIVNPERAMFQVSDWERGLQSIVTSAATSILGTFEFNKILTDRTELGAIIRDQIKEETLRWGIEINHLFISRLSLLPNVSQQLFDTIAARIEIAKADIEEEGRLDAQLLEAETSAKVSSLVTEAKAQYALGVSRAYDKLKKNPPVFAAYKELYDLSQLRPQRTISFHGFETDKLKSLDALMAAPVTGLEGATAQAMDTSGSTDF